MSHPTKPWSGRLGTLLLLVGSVPPASWAQAPAPSGPNLTLIRRNANISDIDRQNVQRWVEEQINQLFTSSSLDADAARIRAAVMEHVQAGDASPAFRQVVTTALIDSLSRRYKGATAQEDPGLPRPLPVVYTLVILVLTDEPASVPALRQAMLDASNPPAPGVRAAAMEGLIRQRERMNAQTWAAVVADVQKLAAEETDPVVLSKVYRFLAAEAPEARVQEGLAAILRILDGRLTRFEKQGQMPSLAEQDAAVWLGTRARAAQNAPRINDMALQLGRLLADAAFAHARPDTPPARKETLERVILAAEQALKAIADARLQGQPQPDVTKALLTPGPDRARQVNSEVEKWIGSAAAPGLLNRPPLNLPAGLNIQRVIATATTTATAPA